MIERHVYKVGDLVYTQYHTGLYRGLYKVARVLKTTIVLDDESRWNLSGYPKPRGQGYMTFQLYLATPELQHKVKLERIRTRLKIVDWNEISDTIIVGVWNLVKDR